MDIQVPICLVGVVAPAPDVDICMDGATHLLHFVLGGQIRLKARNEEAGTRLQELVGHSASVCGYYTKGAECDHLSVYYADAVPEKTEEDYAVFTLIGGGGCRIELADAILPAIYVRAFGPATRAECDEWFASNCI